MFAWGEDVGEMAALIEAPDSFSWRNFWDSHDPVADPLNPAASWRPGRPLDENPDRDHGLLLATNLAGDRSHAHVVDEEVDNINNSSGDGLQAHDYWKNESQFARSLGKLLTELRPGEPSDSPAGTGL
jgi:hypothetical protein